MDWTIGIFASRKQAHEYAKKRQTLAERRRLQIEPLEERNLLSACTVNWFDVVSDNSTEHVGTATWTAENTVISNTETSADESTLVYDWIVQFDTASLTDVSSVADTISLLVGAGDIEFQIIEGLGLAGMVLVRSSGDTLSAVEQYFSQLTYITSFEQDAYHAADETTATALSSISATSAWSITTGSSSVIVAVIDTGVDYTHTALASYIWVNPGEIAGNGIDDDGNGFTDDVYGYDFASDDSDPMDDNGHGTHVTGIITSVADCSIMCLKFMDEDGSGYLSDAIAAINYATMMRSMYGVNVRVDNNSWGGGSFSAAMQAAIQASNDAGILFVAAAGNDGTSNDTTAQYPANYNSANIIVVAAVTNSGTLASFSNYGATTVDIAAPGVSIYSTLPGNRYGSYSGTSMAAPYVSAVAALAWALDPDATVAEVRAAIIKGANYSSSLSTKLVSGGTLNAAATLKLIASGVTLTDTVTEPTVTVDSSDSVGLYNSATTTFYLNDDNNATTDAVFTYDAADSSWTVLAGDWDGDGTDTVGYYNSKTSTFYLLDSNDSDAAVTVIVFGTAGCGWKPLVGDWNGDGIDTVALYNSKTSRFYLRATNDAASSVTSFKYGTAGWTPIAGDWNGDGRDTIGLYNPKTSKFYLRNSNSAGATNVCFTFGTAKCGWTPIAGDWNGDDRDTIGLYNSKTSKFYLRNSNSAGKASLTLTYGAAGRGWVPIVGNWAGVESTAMVEKTSLSECGEFDSRYATAAARIAWLDLAVSELLAGDSFSSIFKSSNEAENGETSLSSSLSESSSGYESHAASEDSTSSALSGSQINARISTAIWADNESAAITATDSADCLSHGRIIDFQAVDEMFDLLGDLLEQA